MIIVTNPFQSPSSCQNEGTITNLCKLLSSFDTSDEPCDELGPLETGMSESLHMYMWPPTEPRGV